MCTLKEISTGNCLILLRIVFGVVLLPVTSQGGEGAMLNKYGVKRGGGGGGGI